MEPDSDADPMGPVVQAVVVGERPCLLGCSSGGESEGAEEGSV